MNTLFEKLPKRRWTWISSDSTTKNETHYILINQKYIVHQHKGATQNASVKRHQHEHHRRKSELMNITEKIYRTLKTRT